MKIISLFITLLFIYKANAQLKIAYDALACAYGMKNNENKWVVKPIYKSISDFNKQYLLIEIGDKKGLMKKNGEIFLPPKFHQIVAKTDSRYLVSNNFHNDTFYETKYGLMDSIGNFLLKQEYAKIEEMQYYHHLLIKSTYIKGKGLEYESSICDKNYKLLFPFKKGYISNNFFTHKNLLLGNYPEQQYGVKGNVKLISWQGVTLSTDSFDYASTCGDNYMIQKNNKLGLMDHSGKILHPPTIQLDYAYFQYGNQIPCIHGHHTLTIIDNNKKGIINGDWKVIIPTQYQSITAINSSLSIFSETAFIAFSNEAKKYRLFSKTGKQIFEADTLVLFSFKAPKQHYSEQDKYNVFFKYGLQNTSGLKFGVIDHAGNIKVDAQYDDLITTEEKKILVYENKNNAKPDLFTISINETQNSKTPLEYITKINEIYFYSSDNMLYPIQIQKNNGNEKLSIFGTRLPFNYGNYVMISENTAGYIFDKTNKSLKKVDFINIHESKFPSVKTSDGLNIWHKRKGKLLPENYLQINQQFAYLNRIWAQKSSGKFALFDTLGTLLTPIEFDAITYQQDTAVVMVNFKKGIVNSQYQWIFEPIYDEIIPFNKNNYAAITSNKTITILNTSNPKENISGYSDFRPIRYGQKPKELYYLMKKNNQEFIFDSRNKKVNATEKEIHLANWTKDFKHEYNFNVACKYENQVFISKHRDIIYDFLYPYYQLNTQGKSLTIINGEKMNGYRENPFMFSIDHIDAQKISVKVHQNNDHIYLDNYKSAIREKFSPLITRKNWILINGKYQEIEVKNLVNLNKSKIRDFIFETISNTPNLKIDCNAPDAIFEAISGFSFADDGIKLYFFDETHQALQIPISLNELEKIIEKKELLKYFR